MSGIFSFLIIAIVSLLPFITSWITSPQEIFIQEREAKQVKKIFKKKQPKRLTPKGWGFLGIAFLTMVLAWFQYRDNQKSTQSLQQQLSERDSINRIELRIRDVQSRKDLLYRDSINDEKLRIRDSVTSDQLSQRDHFAGQRVEESKNETIDVLAKYNLKYDSVQKRLEQLVKDSSKTKIVTGPDPVFGMCIENGVEFIDSANGLCKYRLNLCSEDATSTNFNIKAYYGYSSGLENHSFIYMYNDNPISTNSVLNVSGKIGAYFYIPNTENVKLLIILLKGNYRNMDLSKSFTIDILYYYNTKSKGVGVMKGETEAYIRAVINKHN